ncbi:helix-turn-helix domain-containing protein [Paractinoplanes atraurantiacus]|uniref:DNA-binding prophage protein n=1 Tax=Paractinoplanes atraurantiacus TaxID=1036182 RepID=A0A285HSY8_9ACTN|nr:helix-turn-helix transcriptional regulator [Actinoplanes atraurantiacus]SNY38814.1 DNA-binding prophage protein [Actinoplanes atraurantiacus]
MTTGDGAFWDDLVEDLKDPDFLRAYVVESVRIATIDNVVNALDEARAAAGLSKAALARAIGANPDAIRRLFTNGSVNPTLSTVAEIAAALGMRLTLEPLPDSDRQQITEPLVSGEHGDTAALANHLQALRQTKRRPAAA